MSQRGLAAVQIGFLLVAVWANAASKTANIRIKVLDSETHSVSVGDQIPKNCDAVNFDAYCHNSKTAIVTNTLLVQEGDDPPYRVSCNIDTKWSRCVPLLKGTSLDAKREKHGLVISYIDDVGKVRKQLYTLVDAGENGTAPPGKSSSNSPAPKPAAQEKGKNPVPAVESSASVKCSFTSTPPGAEVTVDGKFAGSTPSVLNLSVGNHTVEVSLSGFLQWKRDLTVAAGSELTINAVLQKEQ